MEPLERTISGESSSSRRLSQSRHLLTASTPSIKSRKSRSADVETTEADGVPSKPSFSSSSNPSSQASVAVATGTTNRPSTARSVNSAHYRHSLYSPSSSRRPSEISLYSTASVALHEATGKMSNRSSAIIDDSADLTPTAEGLRHSNVFPTAAVISDPPSTLEPPRTDAESESKERLSFSSLYNIGSSLYDRASRAMTSGPSSVADSEPDDSVSGPSASNNGAALSPPTTHDSTFLPPPSPRHPAHFSSMSAALSDRGRPSTNSRKPS